MSGSFKYLNQFAGGEIAAEIKCCDAPAWKLTAYSNVHSDIHAGFLDVAKHEYWDDAEEIGAQKAIFNCARCGSIFGKGR